MKERKGFLYLEDGKFWEGNIIGEGECIGELIFYTGVIGYQEVVTDPSYHKKIVVMTYPHIGNYGINQDGFLTKDIWVKGIIVKELSKISSNWMSIKNIYEFAKENKILILESVDTQEIVSYLRENGTKKCILTSEKINKRELNKKLCISIEDKFVSCKSSYKLEGKRKNIKIAVLDLGIIKPHLEILSFISSELNVFPYNTKADEIISYNPDGIFISSGHGNPLFLENTISEIKNLIGFKPILGIGIGMLLLALSIGCKIYKMKVGHYGINQPLKDLITGSCKNTSQAHIYSIIPGSIDKKLNIWFINLNYNSIEGILNEELNILGVQYYPNSDDIVWEKFKEFINAKKK